MRAEFDGVGLLREKEGGLVCLCLCVCVCVYGEERGQGR